MRRPTVELLLACFATCFAISSLAETPIQKYTLDLGRQPIEVSLREFSKQTGLDVSYLVKRLDQRNTIVGPLSGRYTAEAALEKLLGDHGLKFVWINELTIAVTEQATAITTSNDVGGREVVRESRPRLLHIVDQRLTDQDVPEVSRTTAAGEFGSRSGRNDPPRIEEVIVTGSQIRGIENNTAPVIIYDKAYIDSTGVSTVSKLIESLPQNFALTNQAGVLVPGVNGPKDQGSAINLRGLGEGTTLVLLNGRRMASGFFGSAAEISALPLSAVERVEILTDGASALYGSDAVGGVVNFILRRDFDGAETKLRAGWADGDVNEYRVGQALGTSWSTGNALLSLEYYKRDLLQARDRDFVPVTSIIGSLYPEDTNYSVLFSGRQNISQAVSVFADALYTNRDSYNEGSRTTFAENVTTNNPQTSATLGLSWQAGPSWQIELTGSYARNKLDQIQRTNLLFALTQGAFLVNTLFEVRAAQVKADGALFELPAGSVRMAVGADWRSESISSLTRFRSGLSRAGGDFDQRARSAFGEVYVPLVGTANTLPGVEQLDLSLAARYDDYSSFGSSVDPQFGVMWEPVKGLRLRGRYSTSYKSPRLVDYDRSFNVAFASVAVDPQATSGRSNQLQISGANAEGYSAQEAETASFGLVIDPQSVSDLQMELNYYKINYRNKIASPPSAAVVLGNPSTFSELIIRDPTPAQVEGFIAIGQLGQGFRNSTSSPIPNFTPDAVDVILDLRRRNLSVLKTSGFDASIQYDSNVGSAGMHLGLTGTYILELVQKVTPTGAQLDTVDTFYNPPSFRLRGAFGWQHKAWAMNLFVNYTDSYLDNRTATVVPVSSYTTVDARLAYDFGDQFGGGLLSGMTIAASIQNLLDQDPPRARIVDTTSDMGFDPTNASPLGRFIGLEISKLWGGQ